jgi:hypothetical protein
VALEQRAQVGRILEQQDRALRHILRSILFLRAFLLAFVGQRCLGALLLERFAIDSIAGADDAAVHARESVAIRYVDDPNLALRHANAAIERSLLILRTQETLVSAAREIRNRRNYQAIALLTGQSRALKQAGEGRNDRELARDATILARYAERLYDFDGEWFKSVKIWNDLTWDTERFRARYQ